MPHSNGFSQTFLRFALCRQVGYKINGYGLQTREGWWGVCNSFFPTGNTKNGQLGISVSFGTGVRISTERVGMLNIRLFLNDFLKKEGGHIGYSIRPSQRRKGYGTRMLQEALDFLRPIGLTDVIISCGKGNPGSVGVIINCGGVLEEEFYSETFGEVIQRYRIRGTDRSQDG